MSGINWRTVLVWAAALNASLFAAIGIRHLDREALAFAVLLLVGLALSRVGRRGTVGIVLLGLLSVDTEFWMATATVSNIQHQEPLTSVLQPLALAIVSAVVLIAAIGSLMQRIRPAEFGRRAVAAVSIAVFLLALGADTVLGSSGQRQRAADLTVNIQNTAYSTTALKASSGQVSMYVTNQDLFWHTFTIDKLGVNLQLPVGSHRRITFSAPSGTYTFYCQIPGHRQAGMQGTITVP
jgi:plastocyanin